MRNKVDNIHHAQQFLPQTEELACPHAMLEKNLRWLLPSIECYAWCKTTWNKGGVDNEYEDQWMIKNINYMVIRKK